MRGDRKAKPHAARAVKLAHGSQDERVVKAGDVGQYRMAFIGIGECLVDDQQAVAALQRRKCCRELGVIGEAAIGVVRVDRDQDRGAAGPVGESISLTECPAAVQAAAWPE